MRVRLICSPHLAPPRVLSTSNNVAAIIPAELYNLQMVVRAVAGGHVHGV